MSRVVKRRCMYVSIFFDAICNVDSGIALNLKIYIVYFSWRETECRGRKTTFRRWKPWFENIVESNKTIGTPEDIRGKNNKLSFCENNN